MDKEAWLLASIQLQSEGTVLLLRTLWDAPRPELRPGFQSNFPHVSPYLLQILVSITDVNISHTITPMKVSGSGIHTRQMVKSKKYLIEVKENVFSVHLA